MMLAVTVLTYQSVHWYMGLEEPTNGQAGLVLCAWHSLVALEFDEQGQANDWNCK